MKRYFHLVLISVCAFAMAAILILGAGSLSPAYSAGATIKVPDDHATIQGAVDAASHGDTIMVESGHYKENLSITEGITLTGGWYDSFTTREPGRSIIDGQGLGRVISITSATSDTVVTVDGFTIKNGDATGFGMPELVGFDPSDTYSVTSGMPETNGSKSVSSFAAGTFDLNSDLADLAASGDFPGGLEAYQKFIKRLDYLTERAAEFQSRAESQPAKSPLASSPDVGGGIFSHNASLHLLNSIVEWNVASTENDGSGGGIYVSQAPPSGTQIIDNLIQYNTGSMYAEGRGGGLHLYQSPHALIEGNDFLDNVASSGGLFALGGGLYVDKSEGVHIVDNRIERNTAQAGSNCPDLFGGGIGGGAYIRLSDDAVVSDNIIRDNLAALHCGSHTGGLYLYRSNDIQVIDNEVFGNWGVLFQVYADDYGGGIGLDTLQNPLVSGNTVRGNAASIYSPQDNYGRKGYGGGLYAYEVFNSQLSNNIFEGNIASYQRLGYGGGASLAGTENLDLELNNFHDNAGSLTSKGRGGGLHLLNSVNALILHNHFVGNRGCVDGEGDGGGLHVESWGPHSINTRVEANQFIENQAGGIPGWDSEGGACAVVTYGFEFTNNVVSGNTADEGDGLGMHLMGEAKTGKVTNNTFYGNGGTGILVGEGSSPYITITNNIVAYHTVGIRVQDGNSAVVRYTLWDGNGTDIDGSGVISHTHPVSGDPAFADPHKHDYHLTRASAAVDAGHPDGVPPAPPEDLDGLSRPIDERVDLGAYEWDGFDHIYLPVTPKDWVQQIGWVVGSSLGDGYGVILRTTDGGGNWIRQGGLGEFPDLNMEGVAAMDFQNAWVVGGDDDTGIILRTRDGGYSWEQQEIPEDAQGSELNGIYALDGDTAWAVGSEAVILFTDDGGDTWIRQGQGEIPEVTYIKAYASDSNNIWVIGDPQNPGDKFATVLRSEDGGATWEVAPYSLPRELEQNQLIMVHGVDANTVWVVGPQQVSFTEDGGTTWVDQWNADMGGPLHFNGVFAVDRDHIWLARDQGGIFYSTDGGDNYIKQESGYPGDEIMRIFAVDQQTAWAVSVYFGAELGGHVLHTADGGQTWNNQAIPVTTMWASVFFVR